MKRKVTISSFGVGEKSTATIVIDKDGMSVKDKKPSYERDSEFIRAFLSDCLNMDSWKHAWHMDVSKAQYKYMKEGKEARKKIRDILLGKIESRKNETQKLKDAIQILGRWSQPQPLDVKLKKENTDE